LHDGYLIASLGHATRQAVAIESRQNSTHLGAHCIPTSPNAHSWTVLKYIANISVVDTAPKQIWLVRPFPGIVIPQCLRSLKLASQPNHAGTCRREEKLNLAGVPETDAMNVAVLDKHVAVRHRVRVSASDPHATATDRVHNAVHDTRVKAIHLDAVRSMSSNGQVVEDHATNAAGCYSAVYRCVYR
jgi:hypothetical protein